MPARFAGIQATKYPLADQDQILALVTGKGIDESFKFGKQCGASV
jgi:hypothetical protein